MRAYIKRLVFPLCVLLTLLVAGSVFGAGETPSNIALPAGVVMVEGFEPGLGFPVGRVLLVENEVVFIHEAGVKGYKAQKNLPLYKRDTIITGSDGRTRFNLKDESVMTLAPNTRLELNESVYDAKKKSRFSFLNMPLGKTRFLVRKMSDFRRSEFKVKTPTALVGVRGSDFIIIARLDRTEVVALKDTVLEVVSLAYPNRAPILVKSYQKTMVEEGQLPTPPEDISLEEAEKMGQEFMFSVEAVVAALKKVQPVVKPADAKAVAEPKEIPPKVAEEMKPDEKKAVAEPKEVPPKVGEEVIKPVVKAVKEVKPTPAAVEWKVRWFFPELSEIVSKEDLEAAVEEEARWLSPVPPPVIVPEEWLVDPDVLISPDERQKLLADILGDIEPPITLMEYLQDIGVVEETEKIEDIEKVEDQAAADVEKPPGTTPAVGSAQSEGSAQSDMIDMMDMFDQIIEIEGFVSIEDTIDTDVIENVAEGALPELPGFPGTP